MPTLAVIGVLAGAAYLAVQVAVEAILAGPWGMSVSVPFLIAGVVGLLGGFALILGVPLQVAIWRWRLRLQEIARAQSSRTRPVPLRSRGIVVGYNARAMWVEDRGPHGALDRAAAASYRPVAARWKAEVRLPKAVGLDTWFFVVGFGLAALGLLVMAVAGALGGL